jgi:hypothetical protein
MYTCACVHRHAQLLQRVIKILHCFSVLLYKPQIAEQSTNPIPTLFLYKNYFPYPVLSALLQKETVFFACQIHTFWK